MQLVVMRSFESLYEIPDLLIKIKDSSFTDFKIFIVFLFSLLIWEIYYTRINENY